MLSVLSDIPSPDGNGSDAVKSFLIDGTSHCYDMYALYEGEKNQGLVGAHAEARVELKKWLS